MNDLDLMRPCAAFAAVIDHGSFRAAADALGVSPPYVSQMVSDLETRLGRQLLYRSTRKLALTEAGERFLPHARDMSAAFDAGMAAVAGKARRLSGRLRVTAPTILSGPRFARAIAEFTNAHPDVSLEISLDDTVVDPIATRSDLAIRIGFPGDDPRLARKLFDTHAVVCCAPDQAHRFASIKDLNAGLWLRPPNADGQFSLTDPKGDLVQVTPARHMMLNTASMVRALLQAHACFSAMPDFALAEDFDAGRLVNPLPGYKTLPMPAYALFTERRTGLTNARGFVDCLIRALR